MPGKVQLIIDADSKQAQKELASFKKAAQDTTGQITKLDRAASSQHLNAFEKKLAKNTAATRYFGGETKALEKQQRMLRREIERLIRKGMDPLDDTIVQLKRKYDSTGDTLSRLTKKHKTFFASTAKG
ncbi:MAG: hypothetical protein K9L75_06635, partial [Spirochaetia bacterium]|nr:hypothetical protein [Spirochaetia bacterium]